MKALKVKWEQNTSKTRKIANKIIKQQQKAKRGEVDYNNLNFTSISFEKIPMLKNSRNDEKGE